MKHPHLTALSLIALAALPLAAAAQTAAPEAGLAAEPAVKTDEAGITVVGDRESPIGLYISPWRDDAPEAELDRPARFLEEQLLPIDADVFRRQLEYYNTITAHLRNSSGAAAPKAK